MAQEQLADAPDPTRVEGRLHLLQRVLDDVVRQGKEARMAAQINYKSRYVSATISQVEKEEAMKKQEQRREERAQAVLKEERENWALLHKHRATVYEQRAAACANKIEEQLNQKYDKGRAEEARREGQLSARSHAVSEQLRSTSESARQRYLHQQQILDEVKAKENERHAEKVRQYEQHRSEASERLEKLAEQKALLAKQRNRSEEAKKAKGFVARVRTVKRDGQLVLTVVEEDFEKRRQQQEAAEAEAAQRLEEARKERQAYIDFMRMRRTQREEAVALRVDAIVDQRLGHATAVTEELRERDAAVEKIRSARRCRAEALEQKLQIDVLDHVQRAELRAKEKRTAAQQVAFEKWSSRTDQLVAQTLQQYAEFATSSAAPLTTPRPSVSGEPRGLS